MDHIKMIETWAVRYEQTKEQKYLELLKISKKALTETLLLQNEALYALNVKEVKQRETLEGIKAITQELTESHTIYKEIYNMACKGLEAIER